MNDTATIKLVGTVSKGVEQFCKVTGQLIDLWSFVVNVLQQDKWDPNTQQFSKTLARWTVFVRKDKLHFVDGLRQGDKIEIIATAKVRTRRANDGREFENYSFFLEAAWFQKNTGDPNYNTQNYSLQNNHQNYSQNQNPQATYNPNNNLSNEDIPF